MMHPLELLNDHELQEAEDRGLFPNGQTQLRVALIPRATETGREDWVVAGILPGGQTLEVVFAGRRSRMALPLQHELRTLWRQQIAAHQHKGIDLPKPEEVRIPITIEGGWRRRFQRDPSGCETRHYQFIAARWTYLSISGQVEVAGEAAHCDCAMTLSTLPPGPLICTL